MLRGVQPQQRTSRIPPQGGRQIICRAPCNALCEIFMPSRNTSPPLPNNGSEADACCSGLIHYFPCCFCERASGEVEQETLVTDMPMAVEGGVIAQMNLNTWSKTSARSSDRCRGNLSSPPSSLLEINLR